MKGKGVGSLGARMIGSCEVSGVWQLSLGPPEEQSSKSSFSLVLRFIYSFSFCVCVHMRACACVCVFVSGGQRTTFADPFYLLWVQEIDLGLAGARYPVQLSC